MCENNAIMQQNITKSIASMILLMFVSFSSFAVIGPISGSSTICAGSVLALADTTSGGTWSSSDVSIATIDSLTGTATGVAAGTATITYTTGTDYAIKEVTVNPLPVSGTITGLSSICVGSLLSLTDASPGGTWSATNANANVSGGLVTGITAGVDTIQYSVANICGTDVASFSVTLNPLPVADTIAGAAVVCAGTSITLTDGTPGGLWGASTGHTSVSGGIVTGLTPGTDVIEYIVFNSCGVAVVSKTVTVNPAAIAGAIVGPSYVCVDATITLTDSVSGGIWSVSDTNATVSGGVVTGVSGGRAIISYTLTNSCGTARTNKSIDIIAHPTVTISGNRPGCSLHLSSTMSLGASGIADSFNWSASNADVRVPTEGTSITFRPLSPGLDTITCTATNVCGTAVATVIVTVDGTSPVASAISGPTSVCIDSSITLSDASPGGVWSGSAGADVGSTGIVTPVVAGAVTINYTVTNSCGTASASILISIVPHPSAGTITGEDTLCIGHSATLNETVAGGIWTTKAGIATVSPIGSASSLLAGVSNGIDTVLYTFTNTCGTAVAQYPVVVLDGGICSEAVPIASHLNTDIKVYPNPAKSELNITSSTVINNITIANLMGVAVYTHDPKTEHTQIDVANLPVGVYIIKINGSEVKKFVKE